MSDITIPREALEAAMREYNRARDNDSENPLYNACIAMLRNWPGIKEHAVQVPDDASDDIRYTLKKIGIILPLTENTNDKG